MFGVPPELIIGLVTGILSFFAKQSAYKRQDQRDLWEMSLKLNAQASDFQNQAAERSSPALRKTVATIVVLVAFVGLLLVAFFPTVPTTMLIEGTKRTILGIFSWTSKPVLIEASGFFLSNYLAYGVYSVIGFLFGGSLAKATK